MKQFKIWQWMLIIVFSLISLASAQEKQSQKSELAQITLKVDGLSCPFCAYGLEKKLKAIDGVKKTDIKLNSGVVKLFVLPNSTIDSLTLKKKIDEAGFTLKSFTKVQQSSNKKKDRKK